MAWSGSPMTHSPVPFSGTRARIRTRLRARHRRDRLHVPPAGELREDLDPARREEAGGAGSPGPLRAVAPRAQHLVHRDAVQPGADARIPTEIVELAPRLHEGRLRRVFAGIRSRIDSNLPKQSRRSPASNSRLDLGFGPRGRCPRWLHRGGRSSTRNYDGGAIFNRTSFERG